MQQLKDYSIIELSGKDSINLLNNLSTNVIQENPQSIVYSCLLTPNGRFMYDFLLIQEEEKKYIAVNKNFTDGLISYINMYKMSSNCTLSTTEMNIAWNKNEGKFQDPRHQKLGFYTLTEKCGNDCSIEYHINRIRNKIADGFYNLTQKESIILDYGFDDINAISYMKGCYLGQELIARSHHTGIVRKKVYYFECTQNLEKGAEILQNETKIGKILGGLNGEYLALIKFENADFTKPFLINNTKLIIKT
jgi:folate-binding protein YgfZ